MKILLYISILILLCSCKTQVTVIPMDAGTEINTGYNVGYEFCGDHDPSSASMDAGTINISQSTELCFDTLTECKAAGFTNCMAYGNWCFTVPQWNERECFSGKYGARLCINNAIQTFSSLGPDAGSWACELMANVPCCPPSTPQLPSNCEGLPSCIPSL